jgi:hypothetical protein
MASVDVVSDATPPLRLTVPSGVVPSRNVTDPVGVYVDAVTVAVNVTGFSRKTGFGVPVSAITGGGGALTTSVAKPDSMPQQVRA